jgi:hypothetical protein
MNERNIETFRKEVIEFNEIDIIIKKIKEKMEPMKNGIKTLVERKKDLQKSISLFMSSNELSVCNLPKDVDNGAIKYTCAEVHVPMTQDHMKKAIMSFYDSKEHMSEQFLGLSDEEKGQYMISYIQSSRPKVPRESLRRVKYASIDVVSHEYSILEQL